MESTAPGGLGTVRSDEVQLPSEAPERPSARKKTYERGRSELGEEAPKARTGGGGGAVLGPRGAFFDLRGPRQAHAGPFFAHPGAGIFARKNELEGAFFGVGGGVGGENEQPLVVHKGRPADLFVACFHSGCKRL